jgi:NAD+ kinase
VVRDPQAEAETVKRVLILVNPDKPGAREVAQTLCPWLSDRVKVEAMELSEGPIQSAADLVVVLGGDGSILRAARTLAGQEIPVVGINMGKLGYLAEFSAEEFCRSFEAIVAGAMPTSRRMMLAARCETADADPKEYLVLNDVLMAGGMPHRMLAVSACIDGEPLTTYFGDGVLVATPTGSTAYCLAAGGPVLSPGLEALALVPVCPHSLTHRPIILRPESEVVLEPCGLQTEAMLVLDGQERGRLARGDRVTIRRAATAFLLVHNGGRPFFSTLREKLQWGQGPRYG